MLAEDLAPVSRLLALIACLCLVSACSDGGDSNSVSSVRMNEVQYLGTHNSYKLRLRGNLFELLAEFDAELARTLDDEHVSLVE